MNRWQVRGVVLPEGVNQTTLRLSKKKPEASWQAGCWLSELPVIVTHARTTMKTKAGRESATIPIISFSPHGTCSSAFPSDLLPFALAVACHCRLLNYARLVRCLLADAYFLSWRLDLPSVSHDIDRWALSPPYSLHLAILKLKTEDQIAALTIYCVENAFRWRSGTSNSRLAFSDSQFDSWFSPCLPVFSLAGFIPELFLPTVVPQWKLQSWTPKWGHIWSWATEQKLLCCFLCFCDVATKR